MAFSFCAGSVIVRPSMRERIQHLPPTAGISAADSGEPWSVLTMQLSEGANEVGVLLRIATALNATSIPMMNISTFDSNYVIVPASCCSIAGTPPPRIISSELPPHPPAVECCIAALNQPGPSSALTASSSDTLHRLLGSASMESVPSFTLSPRAPIRFCDELQVRQPIQPSRHPAWHPA